MYFVAMAVLIRTLITFYEIPATALGGRTHTGLRPAHQFMSFRFFFGWWGGLTMAVLVYLFFLPESLGGLQYREGGATTGSPHPSSSYVDLRVGARHTQTHSVSETTALRTHAGLRHTFAEFKETLSNRSFLVLFASALFTAVAAGIATSLSIYFTRYFWEFTSTQIGYMQLPYFASAGVALLVAPLVSRRLGKKRAAILITSLSVLMSPLPYILRMLGWFPDNGTPALFPTVLIFNTIEVTLIIVSGILIAAMIADVVEDSEVNTGRRAEGLFFAANSFAQKAVNGLGVIVAGQLLAYVNFPTQAKLGEVPTNTLFDLASVYIPALWGFYLIAIVLLGFYRISRDKHAQNLEAIAERGRIALAKSARAAPRREVQASDLACAENCADSTATAAGTWYLCGV